MTLYGILGVIANHLAYPVINVSHLENRGDLEFPSVTICNANRVHCGNLLTEHVRARDQESSNNGTYELLDELLIISNCGEKEQYYT